MSQLQPFLLFSPALKDRPAQMSKLIEGENAAFFALNAHYENLPSFLTAWVEFLQSEQYPKFGGHTLNALQRFTSPMKLAEAFGEDVEEGGVTYLMLDQVDYLTDDPQVQRFFKELSRHLGHVRVIMNGRQLPKAFWFDLVKEGLVEVSGPTLGLFDSNIPHLVVHCFSRRGRVEVNGVEVNSSSFEGPLPWALFLFLIDRGRKGVTRDEIFETFWPELSVKEATNVFHVTKRKISERLGFELTVYKDRFYRLSPQVDIHFDVAFFEAKISEASRAVDSVEALALWKQALDACRGMLFLSELKAPWVVERRRQLKEQYVEALIGAARAYAQAENFALALAYFLRVLPHVVREDVIRELMQLFATLGQPQQALSLFSKLEEHLKDTFKISPDRQTIALRDIIAKSLK